MCLQAVIAAPALAIVLVTAALSTSSAQGQTFTVLHAFSDAPAANSLNAHHPGRSGQYLWRHERGRNPWLRNDSQAECGTVFEVDKNGNKPVLYLTLDRTSALAHIRRQAEYLRANHAVKPLRKDFVGLSCKVYKHLTNA